MIGSQANYQFNIIQKKMGIVLEFKNINNILRACLNFVQQHFYLTSFTISSAESEREFVVPAESSVIIGSQEI